MNEIPALSNSIDKSGCLFYLPHTSYELGHTWTPSATQAVLDTLRDSFKFSLKVYLTFYAVSF